MSYKTKLIKIDSSKASHYYNDFHTDFMFLLEPPICVGNDEAIVYSLLNAWVPYSFYSVNQYNQYLDVVIVQKDLANSTNTKTFEESIIIPSGNYSTYDFAKTITMELNDAYTGVGGMVGNQFNVVYNRINNTFNISFTSSDLVNGVDDYCVFQFASGDNEHRSCHKLMGFEMEDIHIESGTTHSTGLVLMNDIAYLQIKSDIGLSNTIITGDETDSILEIIPVSSEPLSFISYAPFIPTKFLLHNNNLNAIKISLIDNYGRDVNLNNIPFLITLKIDLITTEEAGVPKSLSRADADELAQGPEQNKSNLEMIVENPNLINKAPERTPLSVADLIEYRLLNEELEKVNRPSKHKDKNRHKKHLEEIT